VGRLNGKVRTEGNGDEWGAGDESGNNGVGEDGEK
jgi:hypothetical protein